MSRDPYKILGIKKTATEHGINKAYLKKSFANHPDRGGDVEAMKDITWAYELLTDPKKRELFDKYGVETVTEYDKALNNLLTQLLKTDGDLVRGPWKMVDKFIKQIQKTQRNIKVTMKSMGDDITTLKAHKHSKDVELVIYSLEKVKEAGRSQLSGCEIEEKVAKEIKRQFERAVEILGRKDDQVMEHVIVQMGDYGTATSTSSGY